MINPKNILLTFDYEPFLGAKSGTTEKCIIQPTDKLRLTLNKYKAKAVFFVDTLYILNIEKHPELNKDFVAITNQLKTLHAEGHYIFPHIHPHWLDAVYLQDIKQFSLTDLSRYSLAKLKKSDIAELFEKSIKCLTAMGISYPVWGYRAGGWCIQPFNLFKDIFISENIDYEFSVLPGYKNDAHDQAFDFSTVTQRHPYYFFDTVEEPNNTGRFIEFPISTIQFTHATKMKDRVVRKYLWKTGDKGFGDGRGAKTASLKINLTNQEMIAIELLTIAKLSGYKKYLNREPYMHWISHPKMITKHGLKMFDKFLRFATSGKYDLVFDFHKMIPTR